jgi:hypothetical protein
MREYWKVRKLEFVGGVRWLTLRVFKKWEDAEAFRRELVNAGECWDEQLSTTLWRIA